MQFQYLSDLHLEFPGNSAFFARNPIIKRADVLILAGDIMNFDLKDERFLDHISNVFEQVYWIPGNHEHYGGELYTDPFFTVKVRDNISYLDNTAIEIDGISFLFTTLWSELSPINSFYVSKELNDFHSIKYKGKLLSVQNYERLFKDSLSFIETELQKDSKRKVVVSHHVPVFAEAVAEEYKNSRLSSAFHTDLSDIILQFEPDIWLYGHTHYTAPDFQIGKTLLTTNQLGYLDRRGKKSRLCSLFDSNKVLTLT